jgi:hypothetical protein
LFVFLFLLLESTVLDEVQLDVPLLPVIQDAAIILKNVPDVLTILEV